jgi:hypothetical protein
MARGLGIDSHGTNTFHAAVVVGGQLGIVGHDFDVCLFFLRCSDFDEFVVVLSHVEGYAEPILSIQEKWHE